MRTARTVGGSRLINLVLGVLLATALGVASELQAGEPAHCSGQRTANPPKTPDRPPPAGGTSHRGYVVAARMGWAA